MATHNLIRSQQYMLDVRPPQQIQAWLERATAAVFAPLGGGATATRFASFAWQATAYRFTLELLDVLPKGNSYSLSIEVDLEAAADKDSAALEAERRWAQGQITQWTLGLSLQPMPAQGPGSAQRHQALVEAWLAEEAALSDVAGTQQAILKTLREGEVFSSVHKEGGTTIQYEGRRFVRIDFGESPRTWRFDSDAAFLEHLRAYFEPKLAWHSASVGRPEADVWRLIFRHLEVPIVDRTASSGRTRAVKAVAFVAVCGLAFGLAYLKYKPGLESRRGSNNQAPLAQVPSQSEWDALGERSKQMQESERKLNERLREYTHPKQP